MKLKIKQYENGLNLMLNNLIGKDITLLRRRYDEALQLQGIPCKYQFPTIPKSNMQGEPEIDAYSTMQDTYIFFDSTPKIKTFRRYGWVVENDENLPFLIHCSWNLPHVQKDSLFRLAGQYTDVPDRVFRVTELTYDAQAPDHLICQCVPVYMDQAVGRTKKEIAATFNKSNNFLKPSTDYRGHAYDPDSYRKD